MINMYMFRMILEVYLKKVSLNLNWYIILLDTVSIWNCNIRFAKFYIDYTESLKNQL